MAKKRLGISMYPEYATEEENLNYLETAATYGFDVLFLALLSVRDERSVVINRYKAITNKAKELGYEICVDVNPMVFDRLGIQARLFNGPLDLSFFKELNIDVMRLDLGMTDMEEAFLSKNKEGIKICLNGATLCDHVGHVLAAGGNPEMIIGCHNYYPHRYTGVSLPFFQAGTAHWNKHNLRLQTFVSSNATGAFGPWPVTEGLPTLELHRDWPIEIQLKHYLMMGTVDDIIIGNCFATKEELAAMAKANTDITTFQIETVDDLPEMMKKRLQMPLSRRGDQNEYMIRTLESRISRAEVEPFHTVDIRRGDVLIDNTLYGQYAGEVQIALKDMKNSGKTNVVGHLRQHEIELLDYLQGSQSFRFDFL